MSDDRFEPRIGRIRNKGAKRTRRFVSDVVAVAAKFATGKSKRKRRFDGSRIGRGSAIGRTLHGRRMARLRARRCIVKTRLVRLGAKALPAARAHLRYIQRDGVTREGAPGKLYSAELDVTDGREFLARCEADRHQFRFIVSAEDGDQYDDLKPLTRRLMSQMEQDLGTRLDWIAVDHFNTEHPHTHILLRGVDDRAQNLIIAREYIAHGLRERAAEIVTRDLGPETILELEAKRRREVSAERLTDLDRGLLKSMDPARLVSKTDRHLPPDPVVAERLSKLESLGLATQVGREHWQLADDFELSLKRLGERGDIIRTMQRELTRARLHREIVAGDNLHAAIIGRVVAQGLSDEHRDHRYLIVDAMDGRAYYVDAGRGLDLPSIPADAVVRITPHSDGVRRSDQNIATVARLNDGRYSIELHQLSDPGASEEFCRAHVRRLEALRRAAAGVVRQDDDTWLIPADYLDRAGAFEAQRRGEGPVQIELLSPKPLRELATIEAPTWLDQELPTNETSSLSPTGFGAEVRAAQALRRQWLIERGFLDQDAFLDARSSNVIAALRAREGTRLAEQLKVELGKTFNAAEAGSIVEGKLTRCVQGASERYGLVERSRDFTLVPWRPVLERRLGQTIVGTWKEGGISWRFGRQRSGPEIG
jgi:type IV secretory pathway VirD2 relaxase